jgi:hypothetical protein
MTVASLPTPLVILLISIRWLEEEHQGPDTDEPFWIRVFHLGYYQPSSYSYPSGSAFPSLGFSGITSTRDPDNCADKSLREKWAEYVWELD